MYVRHTIILDKEEECHGNGLEDVRVGLVGLPQESQPDKGLERDPE